MDLPVHDVLIIGSGPCGLAVASRLKEETPGSLFTDSEHQRFHFMKVSNQSRKTTKCKRCSRCSRTAQDRLLSGPSISAKGLDIVVLDAQGDSWMHSWNQNFERLKISHLRSPMFFHPDPSDRDGLRAFAFLKGRLNELKEIKGVVGKDLSKHQRKQKQKIRDNSQPHITYLDERYRDDYYRPSQSLFKAYCEDIVDRYDISKIVHKSQVNSINFDADQEIFSLKTSTGEKKARIVVLAIGSALEPRLPPDCPFSVAPSVTHIMSSNNYPNISPLKTSKKSVKTIVIVGGGLTSAQVAKLAADEGISKIYLITRGSFKTKHFDVDLHWLAKFRNKSMNEFYYANSDEERWEIMKSARGGGSVNPEFREVVEKLQKQGRLILKVHTTVKEAKWEESISSWSISLQTKFESPEKILADHVIYATGTPVSINSLPAIQPLLQQYPINTVGGMPCLTNELMWREDVPLFITGKLGGLRLGPAAGNLEGARLGAEFIAGKIADLLPAWKIGNEDNGYSAELFGDHDVDMTRLGLGQANQFDILGKSTQSP